MALSAMRPRVSQRTVGAQCLCPTVPSLWAAKMGATRCCRMIHHPRALWREAAEQRDAADEGGDRLRAFAADLGVLRTLKRRTSGVGGTMVRTVREGREPKAMRSYPLGLVIAERRFVFYRRGKRPRSFVVRIGRPRAWPEALHGDWMCTYQVMGLGDDKVRYVCGVDALQALLLTVHHLPVHLAARAKDEQGECRWLGSGDLWKGSVDGVRSAARFAKSGGKGPG